MTRLATVLVRQQRRDGSNTSLRDALHGAVLNRVFKLAGAETKRGHGEGRVAQVSQAISAEDGVGQEHGVRFTAVEGDSTVVVEPLIGVTDERARRDGVWQQPFPFSQLDDLLAEGEQPVIQEQDDRSLMGHPQRVQRHVGGQLLRDWFAAVLSGLLTADRIGRLIQRPDPGIEERNGSKNYCNVKKFAN